MSCGSDKYSNDCVCSTLLAIADAQDKIEDDCHTGCRRSIEELKGRIKPKGFDTIPVLLTICGTPFSAVGAARHHSSHERQFNIFKSFLFRVHDVNENSCCATLELLDPIRNHFPCDESSSSNSRSSEFGPGEHESCSSSHFDFDEECCSEFNKFLTKLENSKKIVRTGIFVTVDLKDFTSVACLPAVITC
ncbi:hypothetical protein IEO70_17660 [Bacillus sp. AGMB 02131]|uniref:Spore coat protein n=1 Tax=Peribacillus faecalis TaxID=2772559 RepID=A0A927CYQ4_9BACI|nr:CotY/CotZ family spore coat protein [Peribacillus faecalis]MBD3110162.1 hypothetical protein [Peribacillus faecalis]